MSRITAVLDASVLIPIALTDTLLSAARDGLYRVRWSDDILEEVRRNLVVAGLTDAERATRRVIAMRQAFPRASVRGYRQVIPDMTNHPKDRHVLAAAVVAQANVIVTANLRDFPASSLDPFGIQVLSADQFLEYFLDRELERMVRVIERQASRLRHPLMTPADVLESLALHVPAFTSRMQEQFPA